MQPSGSGTCRVAHRCRRCASGRYSPWPGAGWTPARQWQLCGTDSGVEMQKALPATCAQILEGHTNRVRGLAFSPMAVFLAGASWDRTSGCGCGQRNLLQTLQDTQIE